MIPDKMKAIVIPEAGVAEVREMTVPRPEAGEVLIRLRHCMICTWEQRIFKGEDVPLPFVPGHEVSGEVAYIPEKTVCDLKVGDPCVVKTFDSCGQCEYCRRGMDNLCKGKKKKRIYDGIPGSGGMAEYIAISSDRVFKLPGHPVDLEAAAFAEPLACCLHSMEQASLSFGEDVVIVGGGIMGQLHILLAKLSGARVILAEPDERRREVALSIGAHDVFNPIEKDAETEIRRLTESRGPHAVIFTVNNLNLAGDYIKILADRGRLVYYGSFHPRNDIPFNPNGIHYSEKIITGSYSPTIKAFWQATQLLGKKLIDVHPLLSEKYDMADAETAFNRALSMETFRVLIRLNGSEG